MVRFPPSLLALNLVLHLFRRLYYCTVGKASVISRGHSLTATPVSNPLTLIHSFLPFFQDVLRAFCVELCCGVGALTILKPTF